MNTVEFLQISSAVVPDREALVDVGGAGKRVSYGEMASAVTRLANSMLALGIEKGQKVAIMSVNSADYVTTYYACAMIGVTFVPLAARAKDEELTYMVNVSECVAAFVSDRYIDLVDRIKPTLTTVKNYIALESPHEGYLNFSDLLANGSEEDIWTEIEDHDATIIIFTSGTTALPKGVVLTYLDLSAYVINTMSPADPEIHEKTLSSVPFSHVAGATAMMSSIWGGRTLVILPQFTPELYLKAVHDEKATHSFVVPTMLKRIMEVPNFKDYDTTSLKLITYGAAPMPFEVVRKACDVFPPQGTGLMNAYGQTESTSTLTFLGPEDHDLSVDMAKKEARLRSVGKPMPDVTIGIMDERNQLLPTGEEGEICVQSDRVMKGYFKQDDATSSAIIDGWLHTGDVGKVDEEGYMYITGRKKDLIIRGGENISPGEIENALEDHPKIEEAAVIGVEDVEWGEVVKAVLVLKPGEKITFDEVNSYTKAKLSSFKAPAYVAVVDELPRNPMGKVLKVDLRKTHGAPQNENLA